MKGFASVVLPFSEKHISKQKWVRSNMFTGPLKSAGDVRLAVYGRRQLPLNQTPRAETAPTEPWVAPEPLNPLLAALAKGRQRSRTGTMFGDRLWKVFVGEKVS